MSASGAGASVTNKVSTDVQAYVANSTITGPQATGARAGDVTLTAHDTSTITATVGAASLAGSVGYIGASVSIGGRPGIQRDCQQRSSLRDRLDGDRRQSRCAGPGRRDHHGVLRSGFRGGQRPASSAMRSAAAGPRRPTPSAIRPRRMSPAAPLTSTAT